MGLLKESYKLGRSDQILADGIAAITSDVRVREYVEAKGEA